MTDLKTPVVFTANRLRDGEVVWLGANGRWVETVDASLPATTQAEQTQLAAIAAQSDADNVIVEPYEIDVSLDAGSVTPVRFRERIRASGPTIRLDLGKQAQNTAHAA